MEPIFATDRLRELLPKVRAFVDSELIPLEKDHHSRTPAETFALLDKKRDLVRKAGLWGIHLSKDEGGLGLTLCEFGQVSEQLAWAPLYGHYAFNCQAPDIGNMELLSKFGTADQKKNYLHPLMEGKVRSCFAMTEPEFAGSDPTRLATEAKQVGNDYVINGHKWFTSSEEGAAFCIVMAVTSPAAVKHQRASMIIVPAGTKGFQHIRKIPVMGESGGGWASHSEVRFDMCRVPATNRIGDEGAGFKLAQERLGPGRIHHCMRWIGIAEKALDLMCRRAATREIEEGVMLGQKQFVQGFIAESRVEIDAARMLVLRTAATIDLENIAAARHQISGIKFYTANVMLRVLDHAIQVHGAMGLTDGTMLATIYQHERGARIYDGADEVHKQSMAQHILKGYGLELKKKQ
jgi:alkylation response protein AidB-like acyl-CoA dehydrogenase